MVWAFFIMIKLNNTSNSQNLVATNLTNIPQDTAYAFLNNSPVIENLLKSFQNQVPESNINLHNKPRLAWMVASTNDIDMQNETVDQEGMDLDTYFSKKGRIKWEHNDKSLKGPESIIGYPLFYRKIENTKTLVVFAIYPESANMKVADDAWNLLKVSSTTPGSPPIGASIEGVTTKKRGKKIVGSTVYNIVLTANPVNNVTEVHPISKSTYNEIETIIGKGLSVEPSTRVISQKTDGDALITENIPKTPGREKMKDRKARLREMCKAVNSVEELRKKAKEQGYDDKEIDEVAKALFGGEDENENENYDEKDKEMSEKSLLSDIQKSLADLENELSELDEVENSFEKSQYDFDNDFETTSQESNDELEEQIEGIQKSTLLIAKSLENNDNTQKRMLESQVVILKSLEFLMSKQNTPEKVEKSVDKMKSAAGNTQFYQEPIEEDTSIDNDITYKAVIEKSMKAVIDGVITQEESDELDHHFKARKTNPKSNKITKSLLNKIEGGKK